MGSKSHDFHDEFIFCRTFILDQISVFCTDGILWTLSGNLVGIISILSTKHLEKWSQSDFTDVNCGKAP